MFDEYLGGRQCEGFPDPLTREGCRLWLERVLAYYGDDPRQVDVDPGPQCRGAVHGSHLVELPAG